MAERMDYDAEGFGRTYLRARELPAETLELWIDAVAECAPMPRDPVILDIGCGTGRFTAPLAERFGGLVLGLDPSQGMLAEAPAAVANGRACYACARGEALPVRDGAAHLAFLSMVYHHFEDRPRALREIARVLAPAGRVVVRNATRENIVCMDWAEHFPQAVALELRRVPSRAEVGEELGAAGLRVCALRTVSQRFADTYGHYYEKISLRALSVLKLISDEDYAAGLASLEAWCRERWDLGPVFEPIDQITAERAADVAG